MPMIQLHLRSEPLLEGLRMANVHSKSMEIGYPAHCVPLSLNVPKATAGIPVLVLVQGSLWRVEMMAKPSEQVSVPPQYLR